MKLKLIISMNWVIILILPFMVGCENKIERSGIVVDQQSNEPLENVSIEIYLKHQSRDSLVEKVFTDHKGYFFIGEKRDRDLLFELRKSGYIDFVSSLSVANDTIRLERDTE